MLDGQALLDQITGAVMADDFDRYRRHTAVPFVIMSRTRTFVVDSEEKLLRGFSGAVQMYRTLRVTDVIRRLRQQSSIGSRICSLQFETHVMRGGDRICAPYPCEAVARQHGEGWQIAVLIDSLTNEDWPIAVPQPEEMV